MITFFCLCMLITLIACTCDFSAAMQLFIAFIHALCRLSFEIRSTFSWVLLYLFRQSWHIILCQIVKVFRIVFPFFHSMKNVFWNEKKPTTNALRQLWKKKKRFNPEFFAVYLFQCNPYIFFPQAKWKTSA